MDNTDELQKKLGIKPEFKSYILHSPKGYENVLTSPSLLLSVKELVDNTDWLQAFYVDKAQLEGEVELLCRALVSNGQLWLCWPKKTSKIDSDLSDSVVRQIGLDAGLVDIKVASIDETWSGLKFVYRLGDRLTC
jgi:hypothetical protein